MTIKSKRQHKKLSELVSEGKFSKDTFAKWEKQSPKLSDLPEKVKPTSIDDLRKIANIKTVKTK